MEIVHIASEMAPIAKAGGLGDVLYGLSKACVKKGHKVTVILPKYDIIKEEIENLRIEADGGDSEDTIWRGVFHGINLILIDPPKTNNFFRRGTIYGEPDDNDRFLYFCKSAIKVLQKLNYDAIHLHDWPTAACTLFLTSRFKRKKTIFTIHNLQYQGRCSAANLEKLHIDYDAAELSDPIFDESFNLMRAAIQYSDIITAVSPSYSKEILTQDFGCNLEGTLLQNKKKLVGILNGIDTEYWNPEADPFLAKKYSVENYLEGKAFNKAEIQKRFGLDLDPAKPLVTSITRLVAQKGPDLILYGIEKTLKAKGQFVLLGSSPEPGLKEEFLQFEDEPNCALHFEYDEPLSHLLYAASDMFLMPSIFEPCGLAQMIALRYGSIPLVRKTGGLKDTISDGKNGFTFEIPDNASVERLIKRAFEAFDDEKWQELVEGAMKLDFSWEASAEKYLKLYKA